MPKADRGPWAFRYRPWHITPGGLKSYLWQPVIASPVIQQLQIYTLCPV